MKSLTPATRILLAIATLAMAAGFFLPMWEIQLYAPQYPEGLNMKIWLDHLSGDFDIINGLNHYIGMKHIKQEMFPEFGYLKYALGFLIAAGLLPVFTGRRLHLFAFVSILVIGAGLGLYDFWRWGYDYGHDLDPMAAISVPGMSYQPPIIGYKTLLNFVAYSGPDQGGWVLIVAGTIAGLLFAWEQFIRKRNTPAAPSSGEVASGGLPAAASNAMLLLGFFLTACDAAPESMRYGQDACAECKMTISDQRFGAQIVTNKGKVFKFDDVCCLREFIRKESVAPAERKLTLVSDFQKPNGFIPVEGAVFLLSSELKSPMRSDCAAFTGAAEMEAVRQKLKEGKTLSWKEVQSIAD